MQLEDALVEIRRRLAYRKLADYKPYGHPDTLCPDGALWKERCLSDGWEMWSNKPWQLDFHAAGRIAVERMEMAANRVGKTEEAAAEVAYHATGQYPDWWEGKRFTSGTLIWTGSPTNETSRDIIQKALLGGIGEELGTGFIPKDAIIGKPKMRQAGVADVVDTVKVRHVSGDISTIIFKTYEQGWRKWQGTAPHVVWLDEEPEEQKIYTEAQTRILTSHGIIMVTFTPLLGETNLVQYFNIEAPKGTWLGKATWDDAPHLDEKAKKEQAARYPAHELKARTMGVPMMGEGGVFPIPEEEIKEVAFEIPSYFARIKGIDFGINHPQATVSLAWDRDRDIVYVYDVYRSTDMDSIHHVAQLNSADAWVPVAWPHDGLNRGKDGNVVHEAYRRGGASTMLTISARWDDEKGGGQSVESSVLEILDRIKTGRFKVFSHLSAFFEEYRSYHRKKGLIVDKRDDVLKATMYAMMMLRYAMPAHQPKRKAANARPILSVSM